MNKTISTVKNPLTVIALFAGLAEVAGTVVLPFVAETNQMTYIWFLMLFPALLVIFFFATLNFNPRVLYAPSDFADEKNYMDLFRPSSTSEWLQKIEVEMLEDEAVPAVVTSTQQSNPPSLTPPRESTQSKSRLLSLMQQDPRSRYMLAESLIIDKLASEFRTAPKRDIALQNRYGSQLFDAVFEDQKGLVLVEIKVFSDRTYPRRMRETLDRIDSAIFALPEDARKNSRFVLAIAYEMPKEQADRIQRELMNMLAEFRMSSEVRMFDLKELITSL